MEQAVDVVDEALVGDPVYILFWTRLSREIFAAAEIPTRRTLHSALCICTESDSLKDGGPSGTRTPDRPVMSRML